MTLDLPRAQPDHAAMDEAAEWACPNPDMSMCAPEFLTPEDAPTHWTDWITTATFVGSVLACTVLGAWLDA